METQFKTTVCGFLLAAAVPAAAQRLTDQLPKDSVYRQINVSPTATTTQDRMT